MLTLTPPSPADAGRATKADKPDLCHVTCTIRTATAICGTPRVDYSTQWCDGDCAANGHQSCSVCDDLAEHVQVCPICETECWAVAE